jgi:FMN-dependent oxidoreductase (nitrilotriacetate monooxygenase family)
MVVYRSMIGREMSAVRKQIILGAHFPGVNNHTVWADAAAGSQIAIESFVQLAATAERAKFDFFFLAEGLRLREHQGRIYDLDVVGRPDAMAILAALAAVTQRLGLIATLNATYHEVYELARQLATLDHLSGGRAGWNVVTSSDAFTGENFRRGGYLQYGDRYDRAGEVVQACRELWRSWSRDDLVVDAGRGLFASAAAGRFEHHGELIDIAGRFNVPRSAQVDPVILQAGDSSDGRDLGAATADGIFTLQRPFEAARTFTADLKSRAAALGRDPDHLKILPGTAVFVADTDAEAHELARHVRAQQVSGATALATLERIWNCDLSALDPDGPLPPFDPDVSAPSVSQGRANLQQDVVATARRWRDKAAAEGWSIRQLVMEVTARQAFIGGPVTVADAMNRYVQGGGSDGFILVPHLTPTGLDDFATKVVPLFQEWGVFRADYTGTTLREHMGLPTPCERPVVADDIVTVNTGA